MNKRIIISTTAIVLIAAVVGVLFWVKGGVDFEKYETSVDNVNAELVLQGDTLGDYLACVQAAYPDYVQNKNLSLVKGTVSTGVTPHFLSLEFIFNRNVDDSREGGNVSSVHFFIDAENSILTKIEHFNGAGKAYGYGVGNIFEEAVVLKMDVSEVVTKYFEFNSAASDEFAFTINHKAIVFS